MYVCSDITYTLNWICPTYVQMLHLSCSDVTYTVTSELGWSACVFVVYQPVLERLQVQ